MHRTTYHVAVDSERAQVSATYGGLLTLRIDDPDGVHHVTGADPGGPTFRRTVVNVLIARADLDELLTRLREAAARAWPETYSVKAPAVEPEPELLAPPFVEYGFGFPDGSRPVVRCYPTLSGARERATEYLRRDLKAATFGTRLTVPIFGLLPDGEWVAVDDVCGVAGLTLVEPDGAA